MQTEKLAICYHAWMIFGKNDDYDEQMLEMKERGFNCIRVDYGAGLLWDKEGNVREDVLIKNPFGRFGDKTTYRVIVPYKRCNLYERFLRLCRAAKKHHLKLILSSWFFLHTNWFCEESDTKPLFDLPTNEKISFFAKELDKILTVLKQENLIDVVAFGEIFNELDGIPFASMDPNPKTATELRAIQEEEIGKLKEHHPDILFAFDASSVEVDVNMIPRNIDVFNFHFYYMWSIYAEFERDMIQPNLDEPEIPEDIRYFMKEELTTVQEVVEEMGGSIKTGLEWPRRISIYTSVDENKIGELASFIDEKLGERMEEYRQTFRSGMEKILKVHRDTVPNSKIVMGEGCTYCALPTLPFEKDSENYWNFIYEQMAYLNSADLWGTVITTTHAPERSAAWESCKEKYIKANEIFIHGA